MIKKRITNVLNISITFPTFLVARPLRITEAKPSTIDTVTLISVAPPVPIDMTLLKYNICISN